MAKEKLSLTYLKECLDYDPKSGDFTWKERPRSHFTADWSHLNWNKRHAGTKAGWKDNKSGLAGVGWQKKIGKWYANGRINDHLQHLGFFEDKFEAICARKSWEAKNGFHPNHGKERKYER